MSADRYFRERETCLNPQEHFCFHIDKQDWHLTTAEGLRSLAEGEKDPKTHKGAQKILRFRMDEEISGKDRVRGDKGGGHKSQSPNFPPKNDSPGILEGAV